MSVLSSSYLQRMCDPVWVAKAYSEYMLDCANAQSIMIQNLSELCQDEQLETVTDEIGGELNDGWEVIQRNVELFYPILYPNTVINPDDFVPGSEKWIYTVNYLYEYTKDSTHQFWLDGVLTIINTDARARNLISESSFADYLLNNTFDDMMSRCGIILERVMEIVDAKMTEQNYNESSIYTLDEGFVNMREFMIQYVLHTVLSINSTIKFSVGTSSGHSNLKDFYLDDLTETMKSTFSSCVAWGFAFDAIRETTIADAIAKFDSLISTVISDTTERFASIVNTARSILTSHINDISSFFDDAGEMLGWNSIINDSFETVDQTNIFDYTGASPLGAINLNSAKGVASAVVKTVTAIGAGIFQAAKSLLGKIWNKAKPIVKAITNDPVDIAVQDDKDESYACSNFKYSVSDYLYLHYSGNFGDIMIDVLNRHSNDWYAVRTYFGEITFKLAYDSNRSNGTTLCIKVDMQCRISNISYRQLFRYGIVQIANIGTNEAHLALFSNWDDGIDKFDKMIQFGEYRPENDEDEKFLYMGFVMSTLLQASLGEATAYELGLQMSEHYGTKVDYVEFKYNYDTESTTKYFSPTPPYGYYVNPNQADLVPETVTNLDFVKVTSGFRPDPYSNGQVFSYIYAVSFPGPGATPVNVDVPILVAFSGFIVSFLYQQYDKNMNPTNYLFLPYCKGTYAFSGGRYRIKTDAENANIANTLASVIVIVVTVALAVVLCKTVTTIFKAKRMARIQRKITILDQKVREGKKLSTIEAIRYRRASSKLSKLQNLSSGLAGSGSKITEATGKLNSLSDVVTNTIGIDPVQSIKQRQLVSSTDHDAKTIISLIEG